MEIIWASLLLFSSFLMVFGSVDDHQYAVQPLVSVKSLVDDPNHLQTQKWVKIRDLKDSSAHVPDILASIENMVQSRAVLKVTGDEITTLSFPSGTKMNTLDIIPYTNVLTLMCTAINYLFDGLDQRMLQKPLKDVDFTGDVVVPKNMRGNSLFELMNKVPQYNIEQIGLVNEMNLQARTVFLVLRDLLGKNYHESWNDAFTTISMDNAMINAEGIDVEASLNDLAMFVQSILLDWDKLDALPVDKMPASSRGNNYAFGWWLNCERDQSSCLMNVLPRDAIISFSPALRLYLIPSVNTGFVIANTIQKGHNSRTMRDLLNFDSELFARMLRVFETTNEPSEQSSNDNPSSIDKDTQDSSVADNDFLDTCYGILKHVVLLYMDFVSRQYLIVRALLWVLFLLVAHLFTAWMYHGIWWVLCQLVKRTHDPRPKIE